MRVLQVGAKSMHDAHASVKPGRHDPQPALGLQPGRQPRLRRHRVRRRPLEPRASASRAAFGHGVAGARTCSSRGGPDARRRPDRQTAAAGAGGRDARRGRCRLRWAHRRPCSARGSTPPGVRRDTRRPQPPVAPAPVRVARPAPAAWCWPIHRRPTSPQARAATNSSRYAAVTAQTLRCAVAVFRPATASPNSASACCAWMPRK